MSDGKNETIIIKVTRQQIKNGNLNNLCWLHANMWKLRNYSNWELTELSKDKKVEVAIFIETVWTKVIEYEKTMTKNLEQYFSASKKYEQVNIKHITATNGNVLPTKSNHKCIFSLVLN